ATEEDRCIREQVALTEVDSAQRPAPSRLRKGALAVVLGDAAKERHDVMLSLGFGAGPTLSCRHLYGWRSSRVVVVRYPPPGWRPLGCSGGPGRNNAARSRMVRTRNRKHPGRRRR